MDHCVFCDFVSGKKKAHADGKPLEIIAETTNTLTILSMDQPLLEDAQLLVITKQHTDSIVDMPENIYFEFMSTVKEATKIVRKHHSGANILINEGPASGRSVAHVHCHILVRDERNRIDSEVWERRKMRVSEFKELSEKYKKRFLEILPK